MSACSKPARCVRDRDGSAAESNEATQPLRVLPTDDIILNTALRRIGYPSEIMAAHDFRAMAATALSEQGWPSEVIERQLAHVDRNRVRAAYQRSELQAERRQMMQSWADYLDELRGI